ARREDCDIAPAKRACNARIGIHDAEAGAHQLGDRAGELRGTTLLVAGRQRPAQHGRLVDLLVALRRKPYLPCIELAGERLLENAVDVLDERRPRAPRMLEHVDTAAAGGKRVERVADELRVAAAKAVDR